MARRAGSRIDGKGESGAVSRFPVSIEDGMVASLQLGFAEQGSQRAIRIARYGASTGCLRQMAGENTLYIPCHAVSVRIGVLRGAMTRWFSLSAHVEFGHLFPD